MNMYKHTDKNQQTDLQKYENKYKTATHNYMQYQAQSKATL